jgi:hypothetical protein
MQSEIIELINRNFHQLKVKQESEYYIKIDIGKFHSSNIFENIIINQSDNPSIIFDEIIGIIGNVNESIKLREYYMYQYQNQIYQRERSFKSHSFTDDLVDLINYKSGVFDYRISLHKKTPIQLFSQHMNYHNILFVSEKIIKITDECDICLFEYTLNNKKIKKHQTLYFKVNVPLSEQSIAQITKELVKFDEIFIKHKSDKKRMCHSLDSVLESEQPLQVSDQDK